MKNKRFLRVVLCVLIFGSSYSVASAQLNVKAVKALIERIIPKQAAFFEVAYIPKESEQDVFEIENVKGKIVLRGNNGVSVASALNYYLRHYCHCLITWNGTNLHLPDSLPVIRGVIRKVSPYRYRYYLNYCTFNYTMSWWNWGRWQQEIDWMALNGINMPLALTGETAIWQKVYKSMGFTHAELSNFFSGPAFFAWFWMSNLDAWGGPLPSHWITTHEELQKKILSRERSLGMTPVLPAFTGHVPPAFKKKFPQAKINEVRWTDFPAVNLLSPADSLFTIIGKKFLKEQTKEYGTSHFYSADIFNEMKPPSDDSLYLNNISREVYKSMYAADTNARWVMMGWLFYSDPHFWEPAQIRALLNAIPESKMIILDLWSENHPVWNRTDAYYGKPWIWNMLHNFGGRIYLGGCMPCVVNQPASLLKDPIAGKLKGLGLTMEGTEQNPVLYQLMLDNVWRNTPVDLNKWIVRYVYQRYGRLNPDAIRAWKLLVHSVYIKPPSGYGGLESVITTRPRIITFRDGPVFNYNYDSLFLAWKILLKAAPSLRNNDGYQYDLVNTGRQVLSDEADLIEREIAKAWQSGNIAAFKDLSKRYLSLITDMDQLLATRKDFLLGKWLRDARSWGITPKEKNLYEFNARDLITLWGNQTSTLHDYASKEWSGLLDGFYKQRWERFFNYALHCLKDSKQLDMKYYDTQIEKWEWTWVNGHNTYPDIPKGDPVNISQRLYRKYAESILKSM